ncbi:hypothetical protein B0T14DRAFT_106493 [Immersiella caudata]|uniref:Uncharacterized protein n=1 Tax=Immersiella caudata TaxID=314043 RepID=A0AA39X398_9PEZI|nr:hypothetical protein B0T14DRAFT_106493 [Immersiella caudata]
MDPRCPSAPAQYWKEGLGNAFRPFSLPYSTCGGTQSRLCSYRFAEPPFGASAVLLLTVQIHVGEHRKWADEPFLSGVVLSPETLDDRPTTGGIRRQCLAGNANFTSHHLDRSSGRCLNGRIACRRAARSYLITRWPLKCRIGFGSWIPALSLAMGTQGAELLLYAAFTQTSLPHCFAAPHLQLTVRENGQQSRAGVGIGAFCCPLGCLWPVPWLSIASTDAPQRAVVVRCWLGIPSRCNDRGRAG